MSEEQKLDTTDAIERAIYFCSPFKTSTPLSKAQAKAAIAAYNEELARHPIKVSLSELESAIAIARKREGKHTMDLASEVTMFFVDLGLPIEVIE